MIFQFNISTRISFGDNCMATSQTSLTKYQPKHRHPPHQNKLAYLVYLPDFSPKPYAHIWPKRTRHRITYYDFHHYDFESRASAHDTPLTITIEHTLWSLRQSVNLPQWRRADGVVFEMKIIYLRLTGEKKDLVFPFSFYVTPTHHQNAIYFITFPWAPIEIIFMGQET